MSLEQDKSKSTTGEIDQATFDEVMNMSVLEVVREAFAAGGKMDTARMKYLTMAAESFDMVIGQLNVVLGESIEAENALKKK